jgi:hypothetical protein
MYHVRRCANDACGREFTTKAYQKTYCGEVCAQTAKIRRDAIRKKAKKQGKVAQKAVIAS